MFIRWFLFHTKMGEAVLVLLERKAGLAIVQAEWLRAQHSSRPVEAAEVQ